MEGLVTEQLKIDVLDESAQGRIVLLWTGRCAERYPQRILGPFLRKILGVAEEERRAVQMDFRTLAFLNSSAITVIVHFLRDAQRQGVRQILVFDPQVAWQKMTSDAVRALGQGDPLLEVRS